jgi:putative solute:sodium symporter small subunit
LIDAVIGTSESGLVPPALRMISRYRSCRRDPLAQPERQVDTKAYWAANLRLTVALLGIWFLVSYGAGILFRDFLDQFSIGGAPLGFWFAQQGSIYVFVALIFYYAKRMAALDHEFGLDDE